METAVICLSVCLTLCLLVLASSFPFVLWKQFRIDADLAQLRRDFDSADKWLRDVDREVKDEHREQIKILDEKLAELQEQAGYERRTA